MKNKIISSLKKTRLKGSSRSRSGMEKERPLNTYSYYSNCDTCPYWVYISLVCDDNLRALVLHGNPPEELLRDAKMNILTEFSELSGGTGTFKINNILREYYRCRSQYTGLSISLELLARGRYDKAFAYLASYGITRPKNDNEEQMLKAAKIVASKAKLKAVRMKELSKRYSSLVRDTGKSKATKDDYYRGLVNMSKHFGFNISASFSCANVAAYINQYHTSLNSFNHGRK